MERPDRGEMMKQVEQTAVAKGIGVLPRTFIIRPMEYKHPIGVSLFFSGVFGSDADTRGESDIWVGTFFDRNEAEAFIMASKSFGQMVQGVRLSINKPVEAANEARVEGGEGPAGAEG